MPKNEQSPCGEEVRAVVVVHLDIDHHHHHFGSTLLTNFYRSIAKSKLNSSNIIINNNIEISNELIYHTKHNSKLISSPQLLYRGSRDGFKDDDFHSRCDNQGPTLTIIKSAEPYNQIFGGFTTKNWKSSNRGEYISDDLAFLFKIEENSTNQQQQLFRKFNIKQNKKQYAILDYKGYLSVFGRGCDIYISNDCNLNNNSYSNFGTTYELLPLPPPLNNDDEFTCGSKKVKSFLAGSFQFKVLKLNLLMLLLLLLE